MFKKILQKIILGYIAFTVLIAILFYTTNTMPPHKILKEDSNCIKGLSTSKVIDMDTTHKALYILDNSNKIYKIDPYQKKLFATYQLNTTEVLQGLSVFGGNYYPIFYLSSATSVYQANVTHNGKTMSLPVEKVLSGLKNPKDIYFSMEYKYTPYEAKRIEVLAILEGDIDKVNIYNIETKEIIESKEAGLNIQDYQTTVATIDMKNLPYYVRARDNAQGIKTRQYLKSISFNNIKSTIPTNFGKITYTSHINYIIPDRKNNYLWQYNKLGLCDWNYIKLDKKPYIAYVLPDSNDNSISDINKKGNFTAYIQYDDDKGLICAKVTYDFYGKVKSSIDMLFWIFVRPFLFFGLLFFGKVG